jgi:zinc D-Ala-D-Ala carboxypeptidase
MQLSPHFTLDELTKTDHPFPNVPGPAEIQALKALCTNVLEPIRSHFGRPVIVKSGYRALKVNRAVGSSDGSQHRRGEASDIEIAGAAFPSISSSWKPTRAACRTADGFMSAIAPAGCADPF